MRYIVYQEFTSNKLNYRGRGYQMKLDKMTHLKKRCKFFVDQLVLSALLVSLTLTLELQLSPLIFAIVPLQQLQLLHELLVILKIVGVAP